ncbi:MAG: hypothetical protein IJ933_08350 [Bacteroidales bacterium]|nr:hypothetical protein [Bacteroidales bacterium]
MENTDKQTLYEKLSHFINLHYYSYSAEEVRSESASADMCAPSDETYSPTRSTKDANKRKRDDDFFRWLFREYKTTSSSVEYFTNDGAAAPLPSNFSEAVIDRLEDSFGTLLLQTINKRGLNNADVYKDANIDRRLFSKIISNEGYSPTKGTVLALAIALKLNLDETTSFLKSAGYALSHSSKADLVVEYFIGETNGNYNIDIVNDALIHFGQPPLGSRL